MKTSKAGLDLIKKWESFQPRPYLCPANYWTIGYGHLIKDYPKNSRFPPGSVLTEPEAVDLLAEDVVIAERAVMRLIRAPLTQGQFDALVSFTFNLGAGKLQASTCARKSTAGNTPMLPMSLANGCGLAERKCAALLIAAGMRLCFF